MASRLRTPTLAIAALSMALCLATIGTAGRSLDRYNNHHTSNPWLLPLWPHHFDRRELPMLIGTASVTFILNVVLVVALLLSALPANFIVLVTSSLSTFVMIVAISFSAVLNSRSPHKDTLQTWTCRWTDRDVTIGQSAPDGFHSLCHEIRFAYYTTIPLLVIQVILFALGLYAVFSKPPSQKHYQIEKQQGHQLDYVNGNVRNVTYEAKYDNHKGYLNDYRSNGVAKLSAPADSFKYADSYQSTPRSSLMEAVMKRSEQN